jgi:hypothetical protein
MLQIRGLWATSRSEGAPDTFTSPVDPLPECANRRAARRAKGRAQLDCFGERIFGVELRGLTRILEAVAQVPTGPCRQRHHGKIDRRWQRWVNSVANDQGGSSGSVRSTLKS